MEKYLTVSSIRSTILFLFILLCFGFSGCAGVGSTVPQERRIPLNKAENYQGNFNYGPLTLDFSYSLTGGSLISGGSNMILAGKASYKGAFDSLDIRLSFLDATGAILQNKFIYSSGFRTGTSKVSGQPFQKTFVVPANSDAITFNYSVEERTGNRQ